MAVKNWVLFAVCTLPIVARAGGITREECLTLTAGRANVLEAEVARVVDGDTIKVNIASHQLSVRMLSIDTPETHFQGKSQGLWGDRAASFLARKVRAGDAVMIEFEGERCDKFGRILGHVHAGNVHLNRLMVEQGLAVNYCIYPNFKYCADFSALVAKNIRNRRGIFSDSSVEVPYIWRRIVSKQPWDKFTGDIQTKVVYGADKLKQVPLANRVFFYNERDVMPPYTMGR